MSPDTVTSRGSEGSATGGAPPPVSRDRPFNRVHRVWKPTPEYATDPWRTFTDFVEVLLARGARFVTFRDAYAGRIDRGAINVILDHHIDYYPIETEVMCRWERSRGIVSSVFLFNEFDYDDTPQRRLWSLEDLDLEFFASLEAAGFEIGYHQNAVGLATTPEERRSYRKSLPPEVAERARRLFARDVDALRRHFRITSFIPHGAGEGNARLLELPEGYEDGLEWAYNNRSRNGTVEATVHWENWTDSVRQHPQWIKSRFAVHEAVRDTLRVKAHTASAGLHHVLVHPGRFGRGMPYAELAADQGADVPLQEGLEYDPRSYPGAGPVWRSPELVAAWEGPRTRAARERRRDAVVPAPDLGAAGIGVDEDVPPPAGCPRWVITDDVAIVRECLLADAWCVPFLVRHERFTSDRRKKVRRGSLDDGVAATDADCDLDDVDEADDRFRRRFAPFFNVIWTHRVVRYLAEEDVPYRLIVLRSVAARRAADVRMIGRLLARRAGRAAIHLDVRLPALRTEAWFRRLLLRTFAAEASDGTPPPEIVPVRTNAGRVCRVVHERVAPDSPFAADVPSAGLDSIDRGPRDGRHAAVSECETRRKEPR